MIPFRLDAVKPYTHTIVTCALYLCPQVPFVGGARGADRGGDDQDGPHGRQLRRERRCAPEDGGRGQSGWTHPFLRKKPASTVGGRAHDDLQARATRRQNQ